MPTDNPQKGEKYLHKNYVYKVSAIGRSRDEILLSRIPDKVRFAVPLSTFGVSFTRVFGMAEVARLMGMTRKRIHILTLRGRLPDPIRLRGVNDFMVRYYTIADIFQMRDILASYPSGRPRKDDRWVTNTHTISKVELKERIRGFHGESTIGY